MAWILYWRTCKYVCGMYTCNMLVFTWDSLDILSLFHKPIYIVDLSSNIASSDKRLPCRGPQHLSRIVAHTTFMFGSWNHTACQFGLKIIGCFWFCFRLIQRTSLYCGFTTHACFSCRPAYHTFRMSDSCSIADSYNYLLLFHIH